ncbi:MAG TPA: 2,3-bisphosphoglycerate-dependent phosphoglycerate mutase [Candidatus Saccharimonadales bacterium]|nr:2,3-bisphosphoglycerate-dependent phosphoglycerate mutase [Candidatus Saccharimonadales bacterium]
MAYITFYDATDTDKQQLSEHLQSTDHHWEYVGEPISLDNLKPESEVISVFVSSAVTREMIEQLPKLKLISCRSTGFNNIDLAAAEEHGVTVTNVPSYGEHTVAEYTFGLILTLSRKLREAMNATERADIDLTHLTGFDLKGKTLGLIGAGRIGQQTAKIAGGFGMKVLAFDPFPNDEKAKEFNFEYVDLDRLAAESDVISLHAPLTGDNHHIVNGAFFEKTKPPALLINTSRGELVDTGTLIEALRSGKLAGVALDVLEGEKLLDADEEMLLLGRPGASAQLEESLEVNVLKKMSNVVITPHNAFNTTEAIGRINQTAAQNIIDFWYGNAPNKVTAPKRSMGKLVVTRHGESEWNALGKWTGTTDVHLTEKGFHEAAQLGQALKDIAVDYAFTSQQIRALETLEGILDASQEFDVPFERDHALNERDYGDYTGMNKWEVRDKIGEEAFNHLRRDWDYAVPNGETLKDVYARVIPYYQNTILPRLKQGQTVLITSHGNAIRALIKYLENISDGDISNVEMPFGNILIYDVDDDGRMTHKEERTIDTTPPPA